MSYLLNLHFVGKSFNTGWPCIMQLNNSEQLSAKGPVYPHSVTLGFIVAIWEPLWALGIYKP